MKLITLVLFALLLSFKTLELFFDFEYTTINGQIKQMNEFAGKKIVVIVLPVTQTENDVAHLQLLDSLSKQYADQYTMIGIPSIEDGFEEESADSLKVWYQSLLGDKVILTAGMYTKKSSYLQHPLFRWLTHKDANMHFDEDVEGPGEMFFINEQGELYGVFSPQIELNEQLLNRMAQ